MFHPKAWRYKAIMKKWIDKDWYNIFHDPSTSGSSGKIPHADKRRAQQKPDVKQWLQKCKTTLINAPGGTTRRVQPLVVSINKPFKDHVGGLFEQHLDTNQESSQLAEDMFLLQNDLQKHETVWRNNRMLLNIYLKNVVCLTMWMGELGWFCSF